MEVEEMSAVETANGLPELSPTDSARLVQLINSNDVSELKATISKQFKILKKLGTMYEKLSARNLDMVFQLDKARKWLNTTDLECYRLYVQLHDIVQVVQDHVVMLEDNGTMTDEAEAMDNTCTIIYNLLRLRKFNSFKHDIGRPLIK
jgi:hypothetical protein